MRANFSEKGEFKFGKFDYEKARETAENCAKFKLDNDEEEMACGGSHPLAQIYRYLLSLPFGFAPFQIYVRA